jgi:hypothetical protein
VEEPELRQHERSREQRRRGHPERRRDERDERDEPDGVLRRQEARKDQEAGDSRCGRGDESLRAGAATSEEPGDEEHGSGLDEACRDGERIRQRPREVA